MIIGIDLLWVRPNICGGTESVIRNLLNGFGMYDDKNEYLLFAGRDVAETFECYKEYPNMRIQICDVDSMKRVRRIAWENANRLGLFPLLVSYMESGTSANALGLLPVCIMYK